MYLHIGGLYTLLSNLTISSGRKISDILPLSQMVCTALLDVLRSVICTKLSLWVWQGYAGVLQMYASSLDLYGKLWYHIWSSLYDLNIGHHCIRLNRLSWAIHAWIVQTLQNITYYLPRCKIDFIRIQIIGSTGHRCIGLWIGIPDFTYRWKWGSPQSLQTSCPVTVHPCHWETFWMSNQLSYRTPGCPRSNH
jgi:hypothetical protein